MLAGAEKLLRVFIVDLPLIHADQKLDLHGPSALLSAK
jgi:hypothetical protein